MINLILGQPGGGKSYEAVAFHIIPAITSGRKVITNLSLKVEVFEAFFPGASSLLEIRNPQLGQAGVVRPFSRPEHYSDPWRHPDTGAGALYVIDECHLALPRGLTELSVEEWYSLHRHEGADVLLITQSYGKISQAIRDLVQVVYRCKKATAFGTNDRYIRKVQDGLRGEVVNTSIRVYEKKYFQFYKSHTLSKSAVQELSASDIVPLWKRWPFKGAAICAVLVIGLAYYNTHRAPKVQVHKQEVVQVQPPQPVVQPEPVKVAPEPQLPEPRGPAKKLHPYDGYEFHLVATLHGFRDGPDGNQQEFIGGYVSLTQQGNPLRVISFDDLRATGYDITYMSPTAITVGYKGYDLGYVVTDIPRVSLKPVDVISSK